MAYCREPQYCSLIWSCIYSIEPYMDFGRFLESLEEDYKEIIFAIVLAFPIAYFDCWKLNKEFRSLELFPQIMLSLAISILFISIGICFSLYLFKSIFGKSASFEISPINSFSLVAIFILTSMFVLTGIVESSGDFEIIYLISSFIFILFEYIKRKIKDRLNK